MSDEHIPDPQNFDASRKAFDIDRESSEKELILFCYRRDPLSQLEGRTAFQDFVELRAMGFPIAINELCARRARLVHEGVLHKRYDHERKAYTRLGGYGRQNTIMWLGPGAEPSGSWSVVQMWQCTGCGIFDVGKRQAPVSGEEADRLIPPGNAPVFEKRYCPTEQAVVAHRLIKNASKKQSIPMTEPVKPRQGELFAGAFPMSSLRSNNGERGYS